MIYYIYSFLFASLIVLTGPYWVWKYVSTAKYKGTVRQRFGLALPAFFLTNRKPVIWIHAVSVGETLAVRGVVEKLNLAFPEHAQVVSTVTKTGQQMAQEKLPGLAATFYLPLDLPWIVNRVIHRVNPQFFVVMETELWPNLFHALEKKQIPIITINGRLSPNSFKNYFRLRFFMKTFLQPVHLFAMQSSKDAERMAQIGGDREIIVSTGNLKYDQALKIPGQAEMALLHKRLPPPTDPVWIAASTHPGEEQRILAVFRRLREEIPTLRLILAPRHPERSQEVVSLIRNEGLSICRVSHLPDPEKSASLQPWLESVLLVDQVGWLTRLYGYAQVAFIGGSLIPHGGQNMLEAAAWSIPTLFGPYTFNFKEATQQILESGGGMVINNEQELFNALNELLASKEKRLLMGEKAQRVVAENAGALERTIAVIQGTILGNPLS
ncbi:MAG: 3-deoxy-D-manno-octulosonic acid transferase [Magnetococcales bacterium]|nr:3-deoxy-D-manno-octulosonic acid transferase [Magnetococcales bacterium]